MPLWDDSDDLVIRVIIGSAIGMLIGFGTCGLGAITGAGESRIGGYVAVAGAVVFAVCGLVLAVSVLVLLVRGIAGVFRK